MWAASGWAGASAWAVEDRSTARIMANAGAAARRWRREMRPPQVVAVELRPRMLPFLARRRGSCTCLLRRLGRSPDAFRRSAAYFALVCAGASPGQAPDLWEDLPHDASADLAAYTSRRAW